MGETYNKERSGSLGSKSDSTPVSTSTPLDYQTENVEDLKRLARDLRQKTRAQAQQIMAWRRAYKMQELLIARLQREKSDQLKCLGSKLLLFESRLIRKQKDISTMLNIRENIIHRQQRIIETLTNRLIDNGLEVPQAEMHELETSLPDLDSLNDSDSAVVMEDVDSDGTAPRFRSSDTVTVARSVSDAIDPNLKYASVRRTNGFLRRPEILETVYSVEEDADNDGQDGARSTDANRKRDAFAARGKTTGNVEQPLEEQKEENDEQKSANEEEDNGGAVSKSSQVKTYNRVMSNHRSVTKPKDVKYKRINKAKSKSLEELRGRLKNWVEQGSKITGIALEHSQSYA